ncbi:helix-turn-helix domain-containing protein [Streptomyces sp. 8L]|uniref:helix-turn-helix domain-containing protein n=1 Tax=Streptomyces sp. 8L TaxID=2877242 RepID=UPI001CD2B9FF|nr:helix-turn-helix domain-containing protein [Streptomyces sp. 8L]MCA1218685.1 helix-turn-helix domain-containing protein [Streptomyces sp. 8L]
MTAQQAAAVLGISPAGVRKLVQRGQLPRAGGTARYPQYDSADVLRLARQRRPASRPLTRRSAPCHDRGAEVCPQAG